jgi:hypothetical protein
MDVLVLLVPGGSRQFRIKEAKHALSRSRRCVPILNLIELCRQLFIFINVLLAVVLPFNGISDPLVALEAQLCKAVLVFKMLRLTPEDVVPSIGYRNSARIELAMIIGLKVTGSLEGLRTIPLIEHTLPLGNGHSSAVDWGGKPLSDSLYTDGSCCE